MYASLICLVAFAFAGQIISSQKNILCERPRKFHLIQKGELIKTMDSILMKFNSCQTNFLSFLKQLGYFNFSSTIDSTAWRTQLKYVMQNLILLYRPFALVPIV